MEKAQSNMPTFEDATEEERVSMLVAETEARCEVNRIHVTLWLLFDTAARRDQDVRENCLRDFKKYARTFDKPRSVAVGAKWLANHLTEYRK